MASVRAIVLIPPPVEDIGHSAAFILKRHANGEIEETSVALYSAHESNVSVVSWRPTLLQGELLRIVLCIFRSEITYNKACDAFSLLDVVNDAVILPSEGSPQLFPPLHNWQNFTPLPDVCVPSYSAQSPITPMGVINSSGSQSALTGQLWEAQAFPLEVREGFVYESLPIKCSEQVIGVLFDIRLAVTAHRTKLLKPLSLTLTVFSNGTQTQHALSNLSGSACADACILQDQLNDDQFQVQDKKGAAGLLRYFLVDTTNESYGQMGFSSINKEKSLQPVESIIQLVATSPVMVLRPLGLTTALVESTMFAKVENLTEEFDLCIESVHTRSCASNTKSELPILLAPHDQYCLALHLQRDLINASQPVWESSTAEQSATAASGSKTVFPLSIKWRPALAQSSPSWAQFGADCQPATYTPIQAVATKFENGGRLAGENVKFGFSVLNADNMAVDLFVFVPSTRHEEIWLEANLSHLSLHELLGEWTNVMHSIPDVLVGRRAVSLSPLRHIGRLEPEEKGSVELEFAILSELDSIPNVYLKDGISSRGFVAFGTTL
eukprot:Gregarina_sp_Poly_1__1180@NODE_128_length_13277_cov_115_450643_g114_i0_p3_GENE_NODE_128_length_13277_cov_115_450643_g114_i0NODE_128_length_13277_cov_115_450643_g114_i0_p3_ORF_typecomplete_len553_score68_31_NODE_128_length_13277_cov_115_450643_g114_i01091412572